MTFLDYLAKFTSRKFLVALAAQIGAIVALFHTPETGDAVSDAIVKIGGLIALVLSGIGYAMAEAKVDAQTIKTSGEVESTRRIMEPEPNPPYLGRDEPDGDDAGI